jgi:hypothetical protein
MSNIAERKLWETPAQPDDPRAAARMPARASLMMLEHVIGNLLVSWLPAGR